VDVFGEPHDLPVSIPKREVGFAALHAIGLDLPRIFVHKGPGVALGALEILFPALGLLGSRVRSVSLGLKDPQDVELGTRGGRNFDRYPLCRLRSLGPVQG